MYIYSSLFVYSPSLFSPSLLLFTNLSSLIHSFTYPSILSFAYSLLFTHSSILSFAYSSSLLFTHSPISLVYSLTIPYTLSFSPIPCSAFIFFSFLELREVSDPPPSPTLSKKKKKRKIVTDDIIIKRNKKDKKNKNIEISTPLQLLYYVNFC